MAKPAKEKHTCQGVTTTGKDCGRSVPKAGDFCGTHADQRGKIAAVKYGSRQQRMLVVGKTPSQLLTHLKEQHPDWRVDPKAKVFARNLGIKTAIERAPGYKIKLGDEVQFHKPAGRLG